MRERHNLTAQTGREAALRAGRGDGAGGADRDAGRLEAEERRALTTLLRCSWAIAWTFAKTRRWPWLLLGVVARLGVETPDQLARRVLGSYARLGGDYRQLIIDVAAGLSMREFVRAGLTRWAEGGSLA